MSQSLEHSKIKVGMQLEISLDPVGKSARQLSRDCISTVDCLFYFAHTYRGCTDVGTIGCKGLNNLKGTQFPRDSFKGIQYFG